MTGLRLNAHIIDLADDTLLVLAPHNGEWLISHCALKNVLSMLDGKHTLAEIKENNPELSESNIDELLEGLRRAKMLSPEATLGRDAAHGGCDCCDSTPSHVVMNLTERCNLQCLYCYVDAGPSKMRDMTTETAVRVASEMLRLNGDNDQPITFVFHGGEPTLNLDAVEAVCQFLAPYRDRVTCQIQTNAVNVTDRFLALVKKHDLKVGISIDGYRASHDATRLDGAGKGSFDRVAEGIARLKAEDVRFGALTVLNRHNFRHIPELLDYYAGQGITSIALLRLLEFGREERHPELLLSGEEIFEAYQDALDWMIAYNRTHEQPFRERTIESLVEIIAAGRRDYMCMQRPCGAGRQTIGVDTEGRVYPCDDLIGRPELYMGNLTEQSLESIVGGSTVLPLLDRAVAEKSADCHSCVWESLCPGVCSSQCYLSGRASVAEQAECVFLQRMIPELIRRYRDDPAVFGLLCDVFLPRESKSFYFNLLYQCNSHCIFCAANHDLHPMTKMISLDMMRELMQSQGMEAGDTVILNGGETTLHPELIEMVELLSSHGLNTILFTNGRRLSDAAFCKALVQAGVGSVLIPFFGRDAKTHDACTGAPGSFAQTVAGVENLIRFRKEFNLNFKIELKLLYIKCLLQENPKILEWICATFPEVDTISLNALIVSDTVLLRQEELIPNFASWSESVNHTLAAAKRCGVTDKIILSDTPYCLLDACHYDLLERILEQRKNMKAKEETYIDKENLDGRVLETYSDEVLESCGDCALFQQCAFAHKLYGDPEAAKESLKMLS